MGVSTEHSMPCSLVRIAWGVMDLTLANWKGWITAVCLPGRVDVRVKRHAIELCDVSPGNYGRWELREKG